MCNPMPRRGSLKTEVFQIQQLVSTSQGPNVLRRFSTSSSQSSKHQASPVRSNSRTAGISSARDMFELYASEGVATREFKSFGVYRERHHYHVDDIAVQDDRQMQNEGDDPLKADLPTKKRKTCVSAEIHPLLLFEEIFANDEQEDYNA
ncbi:predicted protein [Thalassiosira pseudonana CCMP1335]|uniref:Uncharacterized protein n=1 Tax=Thalassiosira pseudonana TaxID=35128 RepID=B8BSI2_THAPS|nr:predicted protein [Thalassiosira pseudonana CCMP1335]EED96131.1 predicted protein [Thalassiosira pseudonana CCMP1335]